MAATCVDAELGSVLPPHPANTHAIAVQAASEFVVSLMAGFSKLVDTRGMSTHRANLTTRFFSGKRSPGDVAVVNGDDPDRGI